MKLTKEDLAIAKEEEENLKALQKAFKRKNYSDTREQNLQQLLDLREELACANEDDIPQLSEHMSRLMSLINSEENQNLNNLEIENPYFARLVTQEETRRRDFYIGTGIFSNTKSSVQVVNWKESPIAMLYFRYEEGDEYEEEIGENTIEGEIITKRLLQISLGELVAIRQGRLHFYKDKELGWRKEESKKINLSGGSGTASRPERIITGKLGVGAKGDQRGQRFLPEITSLIDPKQFDLITAPSSGVVAIQGTAGSGKTTVALHRVAWLYHQDKKRFAPDKMLILVFNRALATYISKLLPSLGVPGVNIDFFEHWAREKRLKAFGNLLPKAVAHNTPAAAIRLKKHPTLMHELEKYIDGYSNDFNKALKTIWGSSSDSLPSYDKVAAMPFLTRFKGLHDWVTNTHPFLGSRFTGSKEFRAQIEALCQRTIDPTQNIRHLVLEIWEEFFSDFDLIRRVFEKAEEMTPARLDEALRWIKAQYAARQDWMETKSKPKKDENDTSEVASALDAEDEPLLLFAYHKMVGDIPGQTKQFSHIFIDEAQDYAAIEMRVMLTVAKQPLSITFAGDVNQQMIRYNAFKDWDYLFKLVGLPGQKVSPLKVSYRSTYEIMEFAFKVLGDLRPDKSVNATRSGPGVELFSFRHKGEQARFLTQTLKDIMFEEPNASVALITLDEKQAKTLYETLEPMEIPRLRLVEEENFQFTPGIDITEVTQVKGLEFDYVIVMDADNINYPANSYHRYLLHIAATRAAHQLWILNYRLNSPLLPEDIIEIKP